MLMLSLWRNSSSRFKRFLTISAFFGLSIIITIAGVLTPLSPEDWRERSKQLEQTQEAIEDMDVWQSSAFFFQNNFLICLAMFVPGVGPFFGFSVLYNTGVVIAAQSNALAVNTSRQISPLVIFLFLFLFPHTWLEFIAYSVALAESVWLSWRIIQRKGRRELSRLLLFIAICGALLLSAAVFEALLILILSNV